MGQRGPLRQPDSVRGLKQGGVTFDPPECPVAPKWLSKAAKKEFKKLVETLFAATVPIKQVDAYSIAMAAQCVSAVAEWSERENTAESLHDKLECSKQVARYQRDCQKWLDMICATPQSRARIGLRQTEKKGGQLAKLLEMKKGNVAR